MSCAFFYKIMDDGYIKLFRGLLSSQVFAHPVALKIWIWCLLKANHKDRFVSLKVGKGDTIVKVKVGQFLFGRNKAEEELNIEGTAIYRWINKFASQEFENMLSLEVHNQYTIITINKWASYQADISSECTTNTQPTHQTCTRLALDLHTNKNDKNDKNDKNIEKAVSSKKIDIDPDEKMIEKIKINQEFKDVFLKWLKYKRDKNQTYKSKESVQLAYKKLISLSNNDLKTANDIVEQSMANNWAGLFELKTDFKQAKPKSSGSNWD